MSASIPSWARVGAKVVCINDATGIFDVPGFSYTGSLDGLVMGSVYTIRGFSHDPYDGRPLVLLAEIVRDSPRGVEGGYDLRRFRPAVEDSDELGIEAALYRAKGLKSKAPARDRADA